MASKLAVVALGGNAFTVEGESGTYPQRAAHATEMALLVSELLAGGWNLALVHGNGPQVGNLAIQQEEGVGFVPAQPLFSLVAMTQGALGSLLECAIRKATRGRRAVTSVVTHVVVDGDDSAMVNPTKPIGPFLTEHDAIRLTAERHWRVHSDAGRGYRRVVASPRPVQILEIDAIRNLLDAGHLVIAAGGGGIPVVLGGDGSLACVEAVVDKDYAAAELARSVGARALVLVTAVDAVQLDFGTPRQRPVAELDVATAERHLAQGRFAEGSMAPKIRAATSFVRGGGEVAVITSAAHAAETLAGAGGVPAGTRIVAESAANAQCTPQRSNP